MHGGRDRFNKGLACGKHSNLDFLAFSLLRRRRSACEGNYGFTLTFGTLILLVVRALIGD